MTGESLAPESDVTVISRTTEDTYTFSDGTTFTKTGGEFGTLDISWTDGQFTSWKDNQPVALSTTREKQDCVKADTAGKWDDISCGNSKNFICQIPGGATPAGEALS